MTQIFALGDSKGASSSLQEASRALEVRLFEGVGGGARRGGSSLAEPDLAGLLFQGFRLTLLKVLGQSAALGGSLLPGTVLWQELENKLVAFDYFCHGELALGATGQESLEEALAGGAAMDPYLGVWTREGLGHSRAVRALQENTLPETGDFLPGDLRPTDLVPLHTGLGLALAGRFIENVGSGGRKGLEEHLSDFLARCEMVAQPGYGRTAREALGLMVRQLRPDLLMEVDRLLGRVDPERQEVFWHGVGRGLYLSPSHAVSGWGVWRAFEEARTLPPHEVGRLNAVSGLAWALTLVNITHPEVVELRWRQQRQHLDGDPALAAAFLDGVRAALLIWHAAVGYEAYLERFLTYGPPSIEAAEAWRRCIVQPCEAALKLACAGHWEGAAVAELFRFLPQGTALKGRSQL
ncbi:MAG: hypothetical protein K0U98_25425 [Deltaproteobacteria bacterium]|nr:hypothetical protein [Deltaproteobacteria bacterium]